eukprot:gene23028-30221_t
MMRPPVVDHGVSTYAVRALGGKHAQQGSSLPPDSSSKPKTKSWIRAQLTASPRVNDVEEVPPPAEPKLGFRSRMDWFTPDSGEDEEESEEMEEEEEEYTIHRPLHSVKSIKDVAKILAEAGMVAGECSVGKNLGRASRANTRAASRAMSRRPSEMKLYVRSKSAVSLQYMKSFHKNKVPSKIVSRPSNTVSMSEILERSQDVAEFWTINALHHPNPKLLELLRRKVRQQVSRETMADVANRALNDRIPPAPIKVIMSRTKLDTVRNNLKEEWTGGKMTTYEANLIAMKEMLYGKDKKKRKKKAWNHHLSDSVRGGAISSVLVKKLGLKTAAAKIMASRRERSGMMGSVFLRRFLHKHQEKMGWKLEELEELRDQVEAKNFGTASHPMTYMRSKASRWTMDALSMALSDSEETTDDSEEDEEDKDSKAAAWRRQKKKDARKKKKQQQKQKQEQDAGERDGRSRSNYQSPSRSPSRSPTRSPTRKLSMSVSRAPSQNVSRRVRVSTAGQARSNAQTAFRVKSKVIANPLAVYVTAMLETKGSLGLSSEPGASFTGHSAGWNVCQPRSPSVRGSNDASALLSPRHQTNPAAGAGPDLALTGDEGVPQGAPASSRGSRLRETFRSTVLTSRSNSKEQYKAHFDLLATAIDTCGAPVVSWQGHSSSASDAPGSVGTAPHDKNQSVVNDSPPPNSPGGILRPSKSSVKDIESQGWQWDPVLDSYILPRGTLVADAVEVSNSNSSPRQVSSANTTEPCGGSSSTPRASHPRARNAPPSHTSASTAEPTVATGNASRPRPSPLSPPAGDPVAGRGPAETVSSTEGGPPNAGNTYRGYATQLSPCLSAPTPTPSSATPHASSPSMLSMFSSPAPSTQHPLSTPAPATPSPSQAAPSRLQTAPASTRLQHHSSVASSSGHASLPPKTEQESEQSGAAPRRTVSSRTGQDSLAPHSVVTPESVPGFRQLAEQPLGVVAGTLQDTTTAPAHVVDLVGEPWAVSPAPVPVHAPVPAHIPERAPVPVLAPVPADPDPVPIPDPDRIPVPDPVPVLAPVPADPDPVPIPDPDRIPVPDPVPVLAPVTARIPDPVPVPDPDRIPVSVLVPVLAPVSVLAPVLSPQKEKTLLLQQWEEAAQGGVSPIQLLSEALRVKPLSDPAKAQNIPTSASFQQLSRGGSPESHSPRPYSAKIAPGLPQSEAQQALTAAYEVRQELGTSVSSKLMDACTAKPPKPMSPQLSESLGSAARPLSPGRAKSPSPLRRDNHRWNDGLTSLAPVRSLLADKGPARLTSLSARDPHNSSALSATNSEAEKGSQGQGQSSQASRSSSTRVVPKLQLSRLHSSASASGGGGGGGSSIEQGTERMSQQPSSAPRRAGSPRREQGAGVRGGQGSTLTRVASPAASQPAQPSLSSSRPASQEAAEQPSAALNKGNQGLLSSRSSVASMVGSLSSPRPGLGNAVGVATQSLMSPRNSKRSTQPGLKSPQVAGALSPRASHSPAAPLTYPIQSPRPHTSHVGSPRARIGGPLVPSSHGPPGIFSRQNTSVMNSGPQGSGVVSVNTALGAMFSPASSARAFSSGFTSKGPERLLAAAKERARSAVLCHSQTEGSSPRAFASASASMPPRQLPATFRVVPVANPLAVPDSECFDPEAKPQSDSDRSCAVAAAAGDDKALMRAVQAATANISSQARPDASRLVHGGSPRQRAASSPVWKADPSRKSKLGSLKHSLMLTASLGAVDPAGLQGKGVHNSPRSGPEHTSTTPLSPYLAVSKPTRARGAYSSHTGSDPRAATAAGHRAPAPKQSVAGNVGQEFGQAVLQQAEDELQVTDTTCEQGSDGLDTASVSGVSLAAGLGGEHSDQQEAGIAEECEEELHNVTLNAQDADRSLCLRIRMQDQTPEGSCM